MVKVSRRKQIKAKTFPILQSQRGVGAVSAITVGIIVNNLTVSLTVAKERRQGGGGDGCAKDRKELRHCIRDSVTIQLELRTILAIVH